MLCPICAVDLVISERQGIEIDYCPSCRGVWLDRGELDKIIERTSSLDTPEIIKLRKRKNDTYDDDYRKHPKRKKKNFLDDIFDIFD